MAPRSTGAANRRSSGGASTVGMKGLGAQTGRRPRARPGRGAGHGPASDLPRLADSLRRWQWQYLPLVLAAVLANYALRFLRWHFYLRVTAIAGVSTGDSLAIFLSGFSLTMTPGKLGEVLKSFLLRQVADVPVSYSASLVFAERLTDVLAMVLLAAVGLGAFQMGWQPLALVTVAQPRRHPRRSEAVALPAASWMARDVCR